MLLFDDRQFQLSPVVHNSRGLAEVEVSEAAKWCDAVANIALIFEKH
jgi:hypothetical protein